MKTRNSTKSKLLSSVIALVLCVSMLIGATFAWFTDTASTGVNKIMAGTLDVAVDYSTDGSNWTDIQDATTLFSQGLWEPGHTEYVYLRVKNAGTLGLKYKVMVTPVSENGGINVNNQNFKLSDYLVFGTTDPATDCPNYTRETARNAAGTTMGLNQAGLQKYGEIKAGENAEYLALVVYMPETVGNEANAKPGTVAPSINLGITVVATQLEAEFDSFDNTYDEDAIYAPEYVAGAYYDYFEAVNVSDTADVNGNFTVTKRDDNSGIIASASGTAAAGAKVSMVITKTSTPTGNFGITVEEGHELNGYDIKVTGQTENSLVQGKLYVGTGLENFVFYHNSAAMNLADSTAAGFNKTNLSDGAYYYDSTDGFVYFATTSFSPFQATYKAPVAAIGTAVYGTVQDAINAAPVNATSATEIIILKDVQGGAAFGYPDSVASSGRNVTINFAGHSYEFKTPGMGSTGTESQAMHLSHGNTMMLKNGTMSIAEDATDILMMIMNYCDLTLDNMTVDCTNASFNYNNSVCRGSLTVTGNTNLIASSDAAKIFDVDGTYGHDVSVCFNEEYTGTTSGVIEYVASTGTHTSSLTIKAGTFTGAITSSGSTKPSITGGSFSVKPEYLATGYKATLQGAYYVVSLCTDHTYKDGVCTECGKVQETWINIENAMTEAPEGYSVDNKTVTISTNYGLAWFAKQVNAGKNFSGYTVKLTEDIDLLDYPWTPINGFTGTFDGGNHTISNVYVNGSTTGNGYGLFGASNAKAYKNVKIHNVYVVGNSALGALVGEMFTGTVDNVHVSGNIMIGINTQNGHIANYNSSYAGGIVGHGYATISNCSVKGNDGSVIGHGRQVGGIYGFSGEGNFTPVKNCTVENVTLTGTKSIGGILGWAHYGNNVNNCSVKNVNVKITNSDRSFIGFITGTTNAEDCKPGQMMEFYGNTVENSSLYAQEVLVSQEATMENMFASYGFGPYYTTDGNGNYVFFANKAEADKYVTNHPEMTIKFTTFNGEIAGASDGATISIEKDISLPRIELLSDKTVTIDLKGHTVTDTGADAFLVKTGKLIVIDSVGGGKINHTGTDDLVWLQNGGTLQLDAGSYSFASKYGITYGEGNLIVNGGSYEFATEEADSFKEFVSSGKTVTINGVSFTKE